MSDLPKAVLDELRAKLADLKPGESRSFGVAGEWVVGVPTVVVENHTSPPSADPPASPSSSQES